VEKEIRTLGVNRAWWHETGILYVAYGDERHREGEAYTKEQAQDGLELVCSFIGDKPAFMIADIREIRRATREARHMDSEDPKSVVALLVGCTVTRMLASAYLGLSRPKHTTRVFSSVEKATAWVRRLRACRQEAIV
jgi:hypothetical protein